MGRLFWKFFLSILLAQVAATIGIGGAFWLRDQARQRPAPTLDSGPPAAIALNAAAATLRHGGVAALRQMVGELRRPQVYVLDQHGRDLLGRSVQPELLAQAAQILADNGADKESAARRMMAPDGTQLVVFASRTFSRPDGARGRRPDGPVPGMMPRMDPGFGRRIGPIAAIVAAVLASLLFAALLAWYFARPIRALRSAFEAASAGDLAPRFERTSKGGDELSDLGRDFDRMSGQLRALMDGQRRLLHDVSHELRSPLARLQAAVGLAHQQPDKAANSLDRIERESIRMDKLIGELLTLSRLEASPGVLRREPVDLTELIDAIVADARFEIAQADSAVETRILVETEGVLIVNGDPDLLWSAFENVVRNAVKHGAAGALVLVTLRARDSKVRVDILDRGPGIAPHDLPSIFAPFFRSGASASAVDGHGLGLAIAQRVVHAHGGQITADNREGGGLQVTFELPRG